MLKTSNIFTSVWIPNSSNNNLVYWGQFQDELLEFAAYVCIVLDNIPHTINYL